MDVTKTAILTAGSALAAQGRIPTVTEAARAAGVSRATAYRYFPTQSALALELELPLGSFDQQLVDTEGLPLADRVRAVCEIIGRGTFRHEQFLRDRLRASLEADDRRLGRQRARLRREVVEELLREVRGKLSAARYARLAGLLDLLMGIESVIVLTDVAGLDQDDAVAALGWAAYTLVSSEIGAED